MTTIEIQKEETKKILKGLEKVYEKLLEFKKSKNSELVVIRDNKIVRVKPEDLVAKKNSKTLPRTKEETKS